MKIVKQTKLDSYTQENSIIVVDIETTGFDSQRSCILEVGICKLDLNSGKITKLFDETIKEPQLTPLDADAWIFSNSNLTFEEILKSKSLDYYRDAIQAIFDKYPATAYNKKFDFDFLKNRGFKIKELPCIMLQATNILKLPPAKPNTLFKWPSAEETFAYYFPHKKYEELHRGFDDAVHEAQVVFMMFTLDQWRPIIE